jgi:hypothetical protein
VRRISVEFPAVGGGTGRVFGDVADAPPLSTDAVHAQRAAIARLHGEALVAHGEPRLLGSLELEGRRYDCWRTVEAARSPAGRPDTAVVPLVSFVLFASGPGADYTSTYSGPPFPLPGLETWAPRRAAEGIALVVARAFDGREAELAPYRRRAEHSADASAQHELALMIWYGHFSGAPGSVLDADPPLRRALALRPRSHALHGLLGEVLLQAGRHHDAARAFAAAARLHSRHPRYHYCASVALGKAGDGEAARQALLEAKRVASPRLASRFTSGSNPLVDYRTSLLREVARVRRRREG